MQSQKNLTGPQIRLAREKRGWTQHRLAEMFKKAGIPVTRDIIASIETQRCAVTDFQIVFFARVLGVSWKSFFPDNSVLENLTPPAASMKESADAPNAGAVKRPRSISSGEPSINEWEICEMVCQSLKITFRKPS